MSAKKNSLFSNAIKKSAYDLMLDQEIDRMYKYGSQNQQNALNVANTVSGNTNYAPKTGAVGDIERDVIKQAQIDRAVQTKALTAKGMFDQKHFALDDAYNHLSSLDYLRSLIPGLQQELENANQQDAEHKARNNYRVNNWQKWDDFNNTRETMQEEEAWAYADYLLNGDTSFPFDMNAYNDAWNEMENDEFFAAQDALRKQYESVDWAKMTDKNATVEDQLYQEAAPGAQAKLDMTNKEIERRETIAAIESEAMAAADFGPLSAYSGSTLSENAWIGSGGKVSQEDIYAIQSAYGFINSGANWEQLQNASGKMPTVAKYLSEGYDFMTPDEIAVYNYYYQRGDTDKAEQYLLALRSDLLYRRAMANQVYESTLSTNGWLAAPKFVDAAAQGIWNIASVPYQIYEAAVGIDDPYSAAFDALNKQGFIRGAQLGAIENADMPAVVKDVLQAVYQGAAGFSDNMARLIASGGNPTAVLIMAGLQSGSGSLQESASRDDMSGAAKIVKAIGAAAMEVGTEKIGLDALFDKGKAGALEYIKGVVLSELGEETINYVSQDALEAVVAFLFDHEAEIRSGDEFWQGLTDTWIQTALSSFMLGSVGSAQQGHQNKQYGSFIQQTADVDALLNLSEELGPQAKSYESGQALKARQAAGKKMKLGELGAFSRALADDIGEANSQVVKDITDKAIVGRLTELGTDEATAKKNAPAIRKLANGEKLTAAERAAVAWDDNATQVVTEMTRDIREGEENRAGNAWRNEYENELKTAQQKNLDKNLKYDRAMRPDKMTKAATAAADKKADELVKNSGNLKGKQFSATIEGRAVTGEVVRFEKGKAGLTAVLKNGDAEEKVNVADISGAADKGAAAVLSYIRDEDNKHYLMTPVEASEMMAVYNQVGGDVNAFVQDYQDVYLSGYAGIDMAPSTMADGIAKVVYGYGVENAKAAEADRASKAGKQGTRGTGKTSWIGKVTESAQVGTQASEETLEAAKERMKPSQRLTVDIASALAKRMNIDVVFFESDLSAGNAIENGSFIAGTNTIYIDINSGANSTAAVEAQTKNGTLGYAVLKTMSHELTHYMEANSAEGYATYKRAVKDALKANGEHWEQLVRSKIDNAIRAGQKLTLQGAEAEVIADASEYMLQDSKFVQDLDNSIKGKIKTFVQNFVAEVKQIFQRLMGGHVESNALRDVFDGVVRYTGNLQQLWDAGMEDAIAVEKTGSVVGETEATKQTSLRDSEYMEAVNSGDTAKAQQMVDEAAKRAGYTPLKLYHGTRNFGFKKFDINRMDDKMSIFVTDNERIAESYSGENPKRSLKDSVAAGNRYDFLNRPASELESLVQEHVDKNLRVPTEKELRQFTDFESSTILSAVDRVNDYIQQIGENADIETRQALHNIVYYGDKLAKIPYADLEDETDAYKLRMKYSDAVLDLSFANRDIYDELAPLVNSPVIDSANNLITARFNDPFYNEQTAEFTDKFKVTDDLGDKMFSGVYDLYADQSGLFVIDANDSNWNTIDGALIDRPGVRVLTRDVAAYAKQNGYKGAQIKNVRDSGGMTAYSGASDVYIFFDNTALKSADPVTYDDNGNVIPLSERFVSSNEDIRYSLREENNADFVSSAMKTVSQLESPDGGKLFSLRSMSEDYDTYREMLINAGTTADEVSDLFHTIDETMQIVESHKDILDFGWNVGRDQRSFNPVKPNSDSLYEVSIDFSSLCRKRLLQQAVQERLEAKYNTVLTKAERVAIRNALVELQKEGKQIEVACALCYVESTRLKSPAQIQRFFDDRRKVLVDYMSKKNKTYKDLIDERADELITKFGYEPGTKINQLNSFQKKAVHDLKRSMYKTYKPTAEEEAIINTAMELPGEMFKSADGLWKLKRDHEVIFDAYTSFVRNATKSKGIETDEAWWAGDSKSISDGLISKMNAENGLRSQSWSDFQVIHLLDYMAAIIELSTRNAKMQTYTKVPDFVNLMGDTGIMINLSLIPQNFDGALNYDPVEGMPIETALMLREMFPNTAGTICIGITDDHIRLLLANGSIDYVIPYHKSSLDAKTRQQMGMKNWQDYELEQSEKNRDYPNTDKDSKNYRKAPRFSEWFNYDTVSARAQEVGAEQAMREAADSYIELCHKRGLQEKFVKFTPEANYWKLLIDRKMINQQTGEIINQQAVKPRFDLDRIKNILQGELDRFARQNSDFNSAIETIDRQWQNGDIRKAAKSKKVQDAVSAFDASVVVQNIVESAKELAEPAKQSSLRDTEDTVSVRDYLMEADESVANTIEEKNALSIYQERLRAHAEASDKVKEAEAALVGKTGDELKEAKGNLAAARARQNELFRRLTAVEKTHHVQSVLDRSEKFLREEITGKTESQIAEQIAQHEADIATLAAELQGLKGAARTQHEADIRSRERIVKEVRSNAEQKLEEEIRRRERIVKQLKSSAARKMAAMNLRYQQAADEMRTRHDINAEINKKGAHIKKIVKNLNDRIIHEGDYKNVKQELKPVVHALVQEFVGGFGSLVFDQKKADSLLATYVKLAEDDAAPEFYSDDVELWLKELSDMAKEDERLRMEGGSSLSARAEKLAVYTKVAEIADHIYHLVKSADEVFVNGKRELFGRYAEEVGNELKERDDSRLLVGVAGKAQKVFDDLIRRGNMIPQYFFESLKNNGLMRLYDSLQQGQREYAQNILAGRRAVTEAKAKYNYYTWSHKPQVFRTKQGHDISLTVEQKLWVYATAKRESSNELAQTHHLDQGGFRYDKNSLPKKNLFEAMPGADKKHLLSAADVENITSTLTAEQKAYADELVEFLSTDMAAIGNEASMNLFGIEKYNEKYYFPFKTDSGDRYQSSAAGSASTTNDARVKHSSFTHALRRKANTALVMGDFTNVVADHINLMSTYASFVVPIESLNRVLNRKVEDDGTEVSIRSLIGRKYGDAAQKYIADLLKDLNGGPQVDNRGSLSWMLRAFKRSAVMGSLSVAVQQPTAYLRAFAYIHPKYFAHLTMQGANETWEKMLKYSGTAVIKDMGRFDVGMGKAADDWIANDGMEGYNIAKRAKFLLDQKGFKAMSDNMVEALTALPGVMDRVTWTHLWKAIEAEQHDLHTEMNVNSASFLKMVGERFDDVVNHTQVYDSILSRSQNMRSKNALTQMSTAFMSESTLNANLYYSALRGGHGKAQAARMITAGIAANLAAAAFAAAVSAWRKEDDDRTALEKYLSAFASRAIDNLNPATMLPFVNDLWNIVSGYDVERTDWSVVADMAKYTETFFTKLTDSEKELKYTDIENFLGSLFNLAGIPYKNVSRDIRSAANFVTSNHSMPSSAGVKYSVIEEINPFWQSTNKAYCQRFVAALVDGDKQEAYDLWDYMTNTKGVSQGSLEDNVRAALKAAVQNGSLTVSQATEFLRKYVPYKNDKDNITKPQEWLKTK